MKIYLDYIFIENLFVSLLTIYILSKLSKEKVSFKWNLFVSLIYAIYSVVSYVYVSGFFTSIFVKILLVLSITYIYFKPKTLKKYFKLQLLFFLIIYIYIGAVIFISLIFKIDLNNIFLKFTVYIFSFFITFLSSTSMWKMWISKMKKKDLEYNIIIELDEEKIEFSAFVDTGNGLKDTVLGLDVIIVSKKYNLKTDKLKLLEQREICIKTLNGVLNYTGYVFKNARISKNKKMFLINKVLIIFVDENVIKTSNYDAIISYDTYLEKLEGVFL